MCRLFLGARDLDLGQLEHLGEAVLRREAGQVGHDLPGLEQVDARQGHPERVEQGLGPGLDRRPRADRKPGRAPAELREVEQLVAAIVEFGFEWGVGEGN